MIKWSEADDALLIRLRNEGYSSAKIGAEFSPPRTRHAVVGRAFRLKLPRLCKANRVGVLRVPRTKHVRVNKPGGQVVKPVPFHPPVTLTAAPTSEPVAFMARRSGQCAWPLWDDNDALAAKTCCGAPCPPEPEAQNCAFHARMGRGGGTPSERSAVRELERAA